MSLVLSGCGGGDAPSQTVVGVVEGVSADAVARPLVVCIDANGNLRCDADEVKTIADAAKRFELSVGAKLKLPDLTVVAEVPESGVQAVAARPQYVLAARAGMQPLEVNGLTTLGVMHQRRALATADAAPEQIDWARHIGLSSSISLGRAGDAEVKRIDAVIGSSLAALVPQLTDRQDAPLTMLQATEAVAHALSDSLTRYIDPSSGTLLRTVTLRTLMVEALYQTNPTACPVAPVASMSIVTSGLAPIVSKTDYVAATVSVAVGVDDKPEQLTARIRGRGNSTWDMPKKPYRVKLDKKSALLGMAADKDWVLLANYSDKSLMRNGIAFCLSRMLGLTYTPAYRYVELTLNGDYVGVYQLTEQIGASSNRVDIGEAGSSNDDPGMGFLAEIDARLDADFWFHSARGVPYAIKSDLAAAQLPNIQNFIEKTEASLFGPAFKDVDLGYAPYLDADSLIDFYLINELMRNNDAFFSSTFVHRQRDGKLQFGPVWDFDIAAGNVNYNGNEATEGWWARYASSYVSRLLEDEQFQQHLKARWQYLAGRLPELRGHIGSTAALLQAPQARNFTRWPVLDAWVWPNAVVAGSYEGEVAYLQGWLDRRGGWMNGQLLPGSQQAGGL